MLVPFDSHSSLWMRGLVEVKDEITCIQSWLVSVHKQLLEEFPDSFLHWPTVSQAESQLQRPPKLCIISHPRPKSCSWSSSPIQRREGTGFQRGCCLQLLTPSVQAWHSNKSHVFFSDIKARSAATYSALALQALNYMGPPFHQENVFTLSRHLASAVCSHDLVKYIWSPTSFLVLYHPKWI